VFEREIAKKRKKTTTCCKVSIILLTSSTKICDQRSLIFIDRLSGPHREISVVHVCVSVYREHPRNFSYFSGLKLAKLEVADVPPPEGHRKITAFNEMFTYLQY